MTIDKLVENLNRIRVNGGCENMDKVLRIAGDIVEAFDYLPDDIREITTSGHELYMRGFNDGKDAAIKKVERIKREILS